MSSASANAVHKGKVITICGNTYKMLHDTRFADHFEFYGSWDTHFGVFEGCGGAMPFDEDNETSCCQYNKDIRIKK